MTLMARTRNTTMDGAKFDEDVVEAVWNKATPIPGEDTRTRRTDACCAVIAREQYGKQTDTGWEIDHINPVSKGGGDEPSNLQPLHWKTNRDKADTYPWKCP